MKQSEILKLESQILELNKKLVELRAANWGGEISNYELSDLDGNVSLRDLFGEKKQLMVIHNMGKSCSYCALWADGINGFLPHLETTMAVAFVSKDSPSTQKKVASERNWSFRMASHEGKGYIVEQNTVAGETNSPGVSLYELKDGKIFLRNRSAFGPYDQFCSLWNFIGLAGLTTETWKPRSSEI